MLRGEACRERVRRIAVRHAQSPLSTTWRPDDDAFARLEVAVFQLRLPRIQADRLVRKRIGMLDDGDESVILGAFGSMTPRG